jgi:agmatinase
MTSKVTFGGIPVDFTDREFAEIYLQSIPYDGTSTWGKGADQGFQAFLDATENMELYDIETDSEVYQKGIHILPELRGFDSPEGMYQTVFKQTKSLLDSGKKLSFFGGEHSISIPIIDGFLEKHPEMTVLQIDAHADLRPQYMGTAYNHACAMHKASQKSNLVQVGIRSMDVSEKPFIQEGNCFFAHEIQKDSDWIEKVVDRLGDKVYISFDLDALDPSIMPATGTPEPGGLGFYQVMDLLRKVFQTRRVLAFDLVELAPIQGLSYPQFMVAKIYYKMLSYWFYYE